MSGVFYDIDSDEEDEQPEYQKFIDKTGTLPGLVHFASTVSPFNSPVGQVLKDNNRNDLINPHEPSSTRTCCGNVLPIGAEPCNGKSNFTGCGGGNGCVCKKKSNFSGGGNYPYKSGFSGGTIPFSSGFISDGILCPNTHLMMLFFILFFLIIILYQVICIRFMLHAHVYQKAIQ